MNINMINMDNNLDSNGDGNFPTELGNLCTNIITISIYISK